MLPRTLACSGSDSENARSVEENVKECKGKKKGDKLAGFSDRAETSPQIAKKVRKNEIVEDPETLAETGPLSSNPEGKEKKKKRKREKTTSATHDPTTDSPQEAAGTSEVTGTTITMPEVKVKKKRNKNKLSAETSDPLPSSVIEPTPGAGATEKPKKPRKKKAGEDDIVDANGDGEPALKSKSKSKKRKREETAEDEERPSTALPTKDRSSQKRKKSKVSVHPNPLDDSDLTEQSRKALIYVYSQSASPETWKFNKARQNWIIRNVWTSEIPEKYAPVVVDYLSKVQGRVRETLIESCKKIISGSNPDPPATQTGLGEKGSPENPPAPAAKSEKTQRAYTLLYALTTSQFSPERAIP